MPFRLLKWGMYGNATYGDCTFAAAAHCWMALTRLLKERWSLTEAEVVAAYLAYCDAYNAGKDNGSSPGVVLQNWHTAGMWNTTLPAWAPIDHANLDEVREVLAAYGCLMVSVNLPKPAYTYQMGGNYVAFRIPVWKMTGTPDDKVIVGAHEIAVIGYDKQYFYAVTWGIVVRITATWWLQYVYAAQALIVPAVTNGFDGLNEATLTADLAALTL
jgi:hypothetical protein